MNKELLPDSSRRDICEPILSKPENIVTLHFSPRILQRENDDKQKSNICLKEVKQIGKLASRLNEDQKQVEGHDYFKNSEYNPKENKGGVTCIECINTEL